MSKSYLQRRNTLVKIYNDTRKKASNYNYSVSEKFKGNFPNYTPTKRYDTPATVEVLNKDCVEVALETNSENNNVIMLNMASDFHPGGGVRKGSTAQEEHIFRCSNACLTLNKSFYPLEVDECIYTSTFTIFKDGQYRSCHPSTLSLISLPALRNPQNSNQRFRDSKQKEITVCKIEQLFQTCDYYAKDILILGALGCGAFHNPWDDMADIFAECIEKYKYSFKKIIFAVLSKEGFLYETFRDRLIIQRENTTE